MFATRFSQIAKSARFQDAKIVYEAGGYIAGPLILFATTTIGTIKGVQYGFRQDNPYYVPLYLMGGTTVGFGAGAILIPLYPVICVGGVYLFLKETYKELKNSP